MDVEFAPDVEAKVKEIVDALSYGHAEWQDALRVGRTAAGNAPLRMSHINEYRLICMRSRNATANAYARIWNLPDIWQKALSVGTFYIIEVVSQHYDPLSEEKKERVLIHELLHIPKTFSGALRPHGGKVKINERTVNDLYKIYLERKKSMASSRKRELALAEELF